MQMQFNMNQQNRGGVGFDLARNRRVPISGAPGGDPAMAAIQSQERIAYAKIAAEQEARKEMELARRADKELKIALQQGNFAHAEKMQKEELK